MFLGVIAGRMSVDHSRVFAVGDTTGDVPMLNAASQGYFVGRVLVDGLNAEVRHVPDGSLKTIAADILGRLGKVVV